MSSAITCISLACMSSATAPACDTTIAEADSGATSSAAATDSAISQLKTFLGSMPPSLTSGETKQIDSPSRLRQPPRLPAFLGYTNSHHRINGHHSDNLALERSPQGANIRLVVPCPSPCLVHERFHFLHRELAILVGIHGSENPFVSRLEFLKRDGPIAVGVNQGEHDTHHDRGPPTCTGSHHTAPHHAAAHHASLAHWAGTLLAHGARLHLLLVWLGRHSVLCDRIYSAICQNDSRYRESQNACAHVESPEKHTPPHR